MNIEVLPSQSTTASKQKLKDGGYDDDVPGYTTTVKSIPNRILVSTTVTSECISSKLC